MATLRYPWIFRAWLASRPRVARLGRMALFAFAFPAAFLLPSSVSFADSVGAVMEWIYSICQLYAAAVTLWGLWKAHTVIGWSVLCFFGFNLAFVGLYATAHQGFSTDNLSLMGLDFLGSVAGFAGSALVGFYFAWFWERRLPATAPARLPTDRPIPVPPRDNGTMRFYLLSSAAAGTLLGLGLLAFILFRENEFSRLAQAWPFNQESPLEARLPNQDLVAFHAVAFTALASALGWGLWRRRNEIIEAGCWLLLPSLVVTAALPPFHPFVIVSTLGLLGLGFLVLRHLGFPRTLLQSRRGPKEADTGALPRRGGFFRAAY